MIRKVLIALISLVTVSSCSIQTKTTELGSYKRHSAKIMRIDQKEPIPPSFISIPKDINIVSIGDSLTEGIGDETNNGGYTGILAEKLSEKREFGTVEVTNYGVMGDRTTDLLMRLDDNEMQRALAKADIIIITIGGNDMIEVTMENFLDITFELFENEQELYEDNLQRVLARVRNINYDAKIMLVGLYNPFEGMVEISTEINTVIQNWNEGSRIILSKFDNTVFVRVDDTFSNSDEAVLSSDSFHPNTKGYELISQRIIDLINTAE